MTVEIRRLSWPIPSSVPLDAWGNIVLSEESYAGLVNGEVACAWGLIPPCILSARAHLWLCTTPLIQQHQFLFVRYSQRMMEKMLQDYEVITGNCRVDSERSIRWIRWLGATFGPPSQGRRPFQIHRRVLCGQ